MIKILFVCLGNICRSPMAEMIMTHLVRQKGLENQFVIDSAATSTEEIGNGIYPPAREELRRHGIPLLPHRARQMTKADYERYDLLLGMEERNLRRMTAICGGDPEGRIRKLTDYSDGRDIADPWYSDRFDITYEEITRACEGLINTLRKEGKI